MIPTTAIGFFWLFIAAIVFGFGFSIGASLWHALVAALRRTPPA